MLKKLLDPQIINDRINISLLVLRVSFGLMMLTHGFPKCLKLIGGDMRFADPIGLGMGFTLVLAVLAEFVGSILIVLGLGTRIGAFLGAMTMLVAGVIQHADDPFGSKEKAFMYLAVYIVLFLSGSGKYSIDQKLKS